MKMGKSSVESYTEHMKHTQPKSHDSEMLQRDKCEKCGSDMQSSFFVASSLGEYRQISDNLGIGFLLISLFQKIKDHMSSDWVKSKLESLKRKVTL